MQAKILTARACLVSVALMQQLAGIVVDISLQLHTASISTSVPYGLPCISEKCWMAHALKHEVLVPARTELMVAAACASVLVGVVSPHSLIPCMAMCTLHISRQSEQSNLECHSI